MKPLLLFCVILFCLATNAQVYTSNCSATPALQNIYRNDAYKLAISRVNDIGSPYKDSFEIPQVFIDSIAKALYAVYNMPASGFKDTLMNLFGFSNFDTTGYTFQYEVDSSHTISAGGANSSCQMKAFRLVVSDTANFAAAWAAGNYNNTPDSIINALVNKFGLAPSKQPFQIFNNATWYTVNLPRVINLFALINWFSKKSGVLYGERLPYAGGGNIIFTTYNADTITLTYRAGCGDCPAGCTTVADWIFKVYSNCTVKVAQIAQGQPFGPYQPVCPVLRGTVMPVTLSKLSAQSVKTGVQLQWHALTEINMDGYVIERSATGTGFLPIGSLPALNGGSIAHTYTFTDAQPLTADAYYRVKASDKSGAMQYTNIALIKLSVAVGDINVYPNPVGKDGVYVHFNNVTAGKYTCLFYAVNGQKLFTKQVTVASGYSTQQIALPLKTNGAVMLVVKNIGGKTVLSTMLTVE